MNHENKLLRILIPIQSDADRLYRVPVEIRVRGRTVFAG